ncbi:hypothetical protein HYT02_02085 [Candidatus Gottesmanbacteria bacterium]|nr:hypothetical protein [Candidatus Gottesmanbacteria bacterium]
MNGRERLVQITVPKTPVEIKKMADLVQQAEPVNFKVTKEELLTLRLHVIYQFIQEQLKSYAGIINRRMEHLDIGVWEGVYEEYLTSLEQELAVIYGIDKSERRIGQTAGREELIPHIISGRLRLFRQDGTTMEALKGRKFDSISAIEIVVGMKSGQEVPLIRQMSEHLKDDGIAFITFDDEDSNISEGHTWSKGSIVYPQPYIETVVDEQSENTASVQWFGQLPIDKTTDGRVIWPYYKTGGIFEVSSHNLRVFEVPFDEFNAPLKKPLSWIGVIRKNSLQ